MDQITGEERRRIAELVAEGAPPWKLHQEINRSRYAIRRAVVALHRPAKREPRRSMLRLSLAEREEISRGLAAGESVRAMARRPGRAPAGGVPGGGRERRARAVPGVRCRPAGRPEDAPAEAGQASGVPSAEGGGGGQAGAALAARGRSRPG